jgi:hypothetical protein
MYHPDRFDGVVFRSSPAFQAVDDGKWRDSPAKLTGEAPAPVIPVQAAPVPDVPPYRTFDEQMNHDTLDKGQEAPAEDNAPAIPSPPAPAFDFETATKKDIIAFYGLTVENPLRVSKEKLIEMAVRVQEMRG